ncbi:MAG: PD40 domain-containing protein [Dehalococcoidia bacterium]|nr:PD40 domain-containing protein [Dehalococcoidia bacterium]
MTRRMAGAVLLPLVVTLSILAASCGNADGVVNLTHNAHTSDRSPSWSPDGNKIVFASHVEPPPLEPGIEPPLEGGIYVMDADGSDRTQVSGDIARSVSWSPDGNRIVYASGASIITMDSDGTNRELVVAWESVYDTFDWPSYSPDGSKILFALATGGIFVVGIDGSNQTRLSPEGVDDYYPAWSPDGTKIAYSERDGHSEIYVMNADGSNPTRLTENTVGDGSPAWSPDGSRIAFISERDGQPDLYTMDAHGGDVSRLTENSIRESGVNCRVSWSPDGTKIAFCGSSGPGPPSIYVVNVP